MSSFGIIEIFVGLAVFLGILTRGRSRRIENLGRYAPDILVGLFLIFQAIAINFQYLYLDTVPIPSGNVDTFVSSVCLLPGE